MSEPISPEEQAVGAPERLHPLFLLTGLGGSLRGLAGGYVAIGYLAVSGRLETAIIGAIALLLFVGVGVALYWTRFEFRVGRSDIRIDSGIISRRHRSIPFDRIQDVDITQGPVARLLGIAQVKFETGGGAVGPNAEEAVLHAIPLARAHEIRELVRATRSNAAAAGTSAAEGEQPPIYRMDLRRLLLAGMFNFSLAVVAGLFGLTQTAGEVVGFDPLNRTFWIGLVQGNAPIAQFILEHRAGAAVAGILLLLVIGAATGIVRTFLTDYGFRLDRTDAGLRRRRGLLTRTDVTLPAKRAQAAIVATGPVRDRFGWRQLKLQNLARDDGGSGDHVLAPLATDGEVNAILTELGWRRLPAAVEWTRVSPAYVWALLITDRPAAADRPGCGGRGGARCRHAGFVRGANPALDPARDLGIAAHRHRRSVAGMATNRLHGRRRPSAHPNGLVAPAPGRAPDRQDPEHRPLRELHQQAVRDRRGCASEWPAADLAAIPSPQSPGRRRANCAISC